MQKQLPSLADLHKNPAEAFLNDELNTLLFQPPSDHWLKNYPAEMKIKGDKKYLPIDKVEFMLKRTFGRVKTEITSVLEIQGECVVTVRIHYKDPVTGEWDYQDGVGAHPIRPNAGGVKTAAPIAKVAAKKDAAEELGPVFGSNLGRKDTLMFVGVHLEKDGRVDRAKENNLTPHQQMQKDIYDEAHKIEVPNPYGEPQQQQPITFKATDL
jgi:hypothetical protein